MRRVVLLIMFVFLFPLPSLAEYKFYLRNGSVLVGKEYERKGSEVIIQLDSGTFGIPNGDILKIEETQTRSNLPSSSQISPPVQEGNIGSTEEHEKTNQESQGGAPAIDKYARLNELRSDLDSLNSEINALEEEEQTTQQSIDTISNRRFKYNKMQFMKLQQDLEPLQQRLYSIQQKKGELLQRKAQIQAEINTLEQQ
jgi:prefoldin subunit 5